MAIRDIRDPNVVNDFIKRFEAIQPDTNRLWGKMTPAQMFAHCSAVLEVALGDKRSKRTVMGYLLGPLIKSVIVGDKPFKRSSPTDPNFMIKDDKDFAAEKAKLLTLIKRFGQMSDAELEANQHAFLGRLTAQEWRNSQSKHLDHHLQQFGV